MKLAGQTMLNAQFTQDAVATKQLLVGPDDTTHSIKWGEGVSVGEVVVEAADSPDFAGTWHRLATVTFEGVAPKIDQIRTPGAYSTYRHRVTVPVGGGTVTTKLEANGSW